MEGWVDGWKAKGENEQYLHHKTQALVSHTANNGI